VYLRPNSPGVSGRGATVGALLLVAVFAAIRRIRSGRLAAGRSMFRFTTGRAIVESDAGAIFSVADSRATAVPDGTDLSAETESLAVAGTAGWAASGREAGVCAAHAAKPPAAINSTNTPVPPRLIMVDSDRTCIVS
jgi:hypothetical protein